MDNNNDEGKLGGFSAYLRRPDPKATGYVAKFFGENGEDSDLITALSLTKYLDRLVKVHVYLIKDRNGKLAKNNGVYPKIAEFTATIKRPRLLDSGSIAQLFAENGENADMVSKLGMSNLQDGLIYVDIFDLEQPPKPVSIQELDQHSNKLLEFEKKMAQSKNKRAQEANRLLIISGFFKHESVLRLLGKEDDYIHWLTQQSCCFPTTPEAQCSNHPVHAWAIPNQPLKKFRYVPLCQEHINVFLDDKTGFPQKGEPFLITKCYPFIEKWARETLLKKMGLKSSDEFPPAKIVEWASSNNLKSLLPPTYINTL